MEANDREFIRRFWGLLHLYQDPGGIEGWLMRHPEYRARLGEDLYEALVRFPRPNTQADFDLRDRLEAWSVSTMIAGCPCSTWADDQEVVMNLGTATLSDWFTSLRARTPWLELVTCKRCGQHWFMATDTVDDVYFFLKLDPKQVDDILNHDSWPSRFDAVRNVWPGPKSP